MHSNITVKGGSLSVYWKYLYVCKIFGARSDSFNLLGYSITGFLVNATPILKHSFQHRLRNTSKAPDNIMDQSVTLRVIHDIANERTGLAKIIIIFS